MSDEELEELLAVTRRLGSPELVETRHRVLALKSIYRLFRGNLSELRDLLDNLNDPAKALPILDVHHQKRRDETLDEVVRRFHNFVAAAGSLVDHTRRHMRSVYEEGSTVREQYERGVELRFGSWDVADVIAGLRNYMLHRELPVTNITETWSEDEFRVDPGFYTSQLLEWDGWSAAAREYLEHAGESVAISALATEYGNRVAEFYEWFGHFQALHDLEGIRELDRLEARQADLGERLGLIPPQYE